jgi:hypothetical protein
VKVSERIWRGAEESYHRPLPDLLGVAQHSYSQELQRAMADFGLDHSFSAAAAKIKEHYRFEVPVSSLRRHTLRHSARIAAKGQRTAAASRGLPVRGAECLVAEADGSMVPMVRFEGRGQDRRKNRKVDYHEVRLCACRASGSQRTHYRAGIGSPEAIGSLWKQCAREAGRGLNTFVHALGDGAVWIEQQAKSQLQCDRLLLDFFHVCEYLKEAEPACAPNPCWFATQKKRLLRNRNDLVIKDLALHLEPPGCPNEQAPVRCAHRYLSNRLSHLDYYGSRQQNLPIGSGLIESGHKHVIQARMKIAGAAWLPASANTFIQTRAHRASGLWDCFWKN